MSDDQKLTELARQVEQGFPPDKKLLSPALRYLWRARDELSLVEGGVAYKSRVVVPKTLRKIVLETLHSAHQVLYGMLLRADKSVRREHFPITEAVSHSDKNGQQIRVWNSNQGPMGTAPHPPRIR